jgi:hypothetical protein
MFSAYFLTYPSAQALTFLHLLYICLHLFNFFSIFNVHFILSVVTYPYAQPLTLLHLLSTSCPVQVNITMIYRRLSISLREESSEACMLVRSGHRDCKPSTSHFRAAV